MKGGKTVNELIDIEPVYYVHYFYIPIDWEIVRQCQHGFCFDLALT